MSRDLGASPVIGDTLALDVYTSQSPHLAPLESGGALFLVTVRPPGERLWLVAILEQPRSDGSAWRARPNGVAISDITGLRHRIRFQSGKGISVAAGALGMSLQTPRVLSREDVELLRDARAAPAADVESIPVPSRPPAAKSASAARARYEVGEGPARRFWEIEQKGDVVTTWFGTFGCDGRSAVRKHASTDAARDAAARLVREKLAQGYGAPRRAPAPGAASARGVSLRNPELEAAIERDPDDEQAFLVYGDWLQAQRDPRGELVAIQHAMLREPDSASLERQETALLEKFRAELLGPLARFKVVSGTTRSRRCFYWRLGFIHTARLWRISEAPTLPELVGMLLAHPSGRFVRKLILGRGIWAESGQSDLERALGVLAAQAPSTLGWLVVGEHPGTTGDLEIVWNGLPSLRKLTLLGLQHRLGKVDAPALEHLDVRGDQVPNEAPALVAIATARWPELESLRLTWHAQAHSAALQPLLDGDRVPRLRHLALSSIYRADDIVERLVRSRLLRRLTRLDLDLDGITQAGAEAVLAGADAFDHLESLRITEDVRFGATLRRRLTERIPAIRWAPELERDDD